MKLSKKHVHLTRVIVIEDGLCWYWTWPVDISYTLSSVKMKSWIGVITIMEYSSQYWMVQIDINQAEPQLQWHQLKMYFEGQY